MLLFLFCIAAHDCGCNVKDILHLSDILSDIIQLVAFCKGEFSKCLTMNWNYLINLNWSRIYFRQIYLVSQLLHTHNFSTTVTSLTLFREGETKMSMYQFLFFSYPVMGRVSLNMHNFYFHHINVIEIKCHGHRKTSSKSWSLSKW